MLKGIYANNVNDIQAFNIIIFKTFMNYSQIITANQSVRIAELLEYIRELTIC